MPTRVVPHFVYEKPNTPNVPIKFAFYSAKVNKHFAKSPQFDVANVPGVAWSDVLVGELVRGRASARGKP